jgi:hypothetical protein
MMLESSDAAANNGMHPTPLQLESHGGCVGARVMLGVRCLNQLKIFYFQTDNTIVIVGAGLIESY